jgi:hypothetical protein
MLEYHEIENVIVAELRAETAVFSEVQDMLDVMGDAGANGCDRIIINEENLHPDFFKLHTGLAGEILQKFSTYSVKLAIVGDFSKYKSKSLQDFIRESNRGNRVFFVNSHDEATKKLCGIKTQ